MIHRFQNNGYHIVMDVNSGSVHVMDELAYELTGTLDQFLSDKGHDIHDVFEDEIKSSLKEKISAVSSVSDRDSFDEAYEEILDLIREETLFTPDRYEERIERFAELPTVVKALCLHVSHDCNLACTYCFAGEGEYHGRREMMSAAVGRRALEFLIEHSGSRRNLEVDFFGGEPLLNFDVVRELVAYGRTLEKERDKHFRFTLTTNGVLLNDSITDFLNREMDNVVLSLDGRREVHDRMRPFRGGAGSYDRIVPKLQRFAKRRGDKKYYVRGTFTGYNTDFSMDVLHLADLGFSQISIEPVVAKETDAYALSKDDLPRLFSEYDRLAAEMAARQGTDREFDFFHFMIDLTGGPCVYKRLSGCGSGTEYLAVTPSGDLYPCHQFAGEKDFYMGNVFEGVTNTRLREEFKGCTVYARPQCRECFARFYCSGGCAANALHFAGDIRKTYDIGCELEKKRIECALMLMVHRSELEEG